MEPTIPTQPMQNSIQNEPNKKSSGPLMAVVVILLLIIIGGLYFLNQQMKKSYDIPQSTETTEDTDAITASLKAQSSSDDLDSIEADLNATQVDNLDQGAAAVES